MPHPHLSLIDCPMYILRVCVGKKVYITRSVFVPTYESNMELIVEWGSGRLNLRGEVGADGRKKKKTENLVRANKKGSAGRAEVDWEKAEGCGARTEERSGADYFSGEFTAPRDCVCVREFEQLNHRNFISVCRARDITVRSVVPRGDFGSGPSAARFENFFHSSAANSSSGIWENGVLNWTGRIVGRYKWYRYRRKKKWFKDLFITLISNCLH